MTKKGRETEQVRAWRNRIVGEGMEPAGQLLANPRNWRIHPKEQEEALTGVLAEVGWVQRIIVNRRTGCVVDGHLRVAAALRRSEEEMVPVVYVDLTEGEEAMVLATYDPLSAMAGTDNAKLDELLADLSKARIDLIEEAESAGVEPPVVESVSELITGLTQVAPTQYSPPTQEQVDKAVADEIEGTFDSQFVPYCSLHDRMDVVRGPCGVGCVYCFTRISPAARAREGSIRRVTSSSISKFLDVVEKRSRLAIIGICNEPLQDKGIEPMIQVLQEAAKRGLVVRVQTKLPGRLVKCLVDGGVDGTGVQCWTSFGVCDDADWRAVEPGCPSPMERAKQSEALHHMGVAVYCRFQPFLLGRHNGRRELIEAMKFSKRVIVEPLRISRAGWQYFLKLNRMDGFSLDAYVAEWGRKGDGAMFGALHWIDYDVAKLGREMILIRDMAHSAGMGFGICSGSHGWQYARLNDGVFCCDCGDKRIRPDVHGLAHKVCDGTIANLQLQHFEGTSPGTPEWEVASKRVTWANDPTYRLLSYEEMLDFTAANDEPMDKEGSRP